MLTYIFASILILHLFYYDIDQKKKFKDAHSCPKQIILIFKTSNHLPQSTSSMNLIELL